LKKKRRPFWAPREKIAGKIEILRHGREAHHGPRPRGGQQTKRKSIEKGKPGWASPGGRRIEEVRFLNAGGNSQKGEAGKDSGERNGGSSRGKLGRSTQGSRPREARAAEGENKGGQKEWKPGLRWSAKRKGPKKGTGGFKERGGSPAKVILGGGGRFYFQRRKKFLNFHKEPESV